MHPQSDGTVKRYVKAVGKHFGKVVLTNYRYWDERLPLFLLAHGASTHVTTGMMPAIMAFWRELCLPCDLLFGTPPDMEYPKTYYMKGPVEQLQDIHYYEVQREAGMK
jgi:hypothetical protein